MVSIRRRKRKKGDKFVVDYRDGAGIRRLITCNTRGDADHVAGEKMLEAGQASGAPAVDANITVTQYVEHFLRILPATVKPATCQLYGSVLNHHVVPALGWVKVRRLQVAQVRAFVATKSEAGLSVGLLRMVLAALSAMLTSAVDDGVIRVNPAIGLKRRFRMLRQDSTIEGDVKAMTAEQLSRFLEKTRVDYRDFYAVFFLMARTGVRIGEALALQWADVDLRDRSIRVRRTLAVGAGKTRADRVGTPKSGKSRTVDMSRELAAVLRDCQRQRNVEALRRGWGDSVPWLFANDAGQPLSAEQVRSIFSRALKSAELPGYLTPHCLRHTFATLLLQDSAPITYVQAQLGHSSIQMTVDTYGRWLPTGNKDLVDRLDSTRPAADKQAERQAVAAAGGDQSVTNFDFPEMPDPQVIDSIGSAADLTPPRAFTPI
jgi:integrase